MYNYFLGGVVLMFFLCVSAVSKAVECSNILAAGRWGQRADIENLPDQKESLTMTSSIICTNTFRYALRDFRIDQKPLHGHTGVNQTMDAKGFAYEPDQYFSGTDNFVVSFEIIATSGKAVRKKISVHVQISK